MDETNREKVFMLEEQNKALAKQYFLSYEENKQLLVENKRHCDQIIDLQKTCDAYQSVLQILYSRIMNMINISMDKLGLLVPLENSNDIITAFGNDIMDETTVSSLLAVSIPSHQLKQSEPKSLLPDDKSSIILSRLSQLESILTGEKPGDVPIPKGTFSNDILRSAIISSFNRIQLLLEEIEGLQGQIKHLEREIVTCKTEQKEEPKEESPASAPSPVPIRKQVEMALEKKEENKDGNEELRLEITKLCILAENRAKELAQAEQEIETLEKEVQKYQSQYIDGLAQSPYHNREMEYELEGLRKEVSELQHQNEMESKRQKVLRNDMDSALNLMEFRLKENKQQMEEERTRFETEIEQLKQDGAKVLQEKEAFEQKLKRRKLFSELYKSVEEIIHKLYKVIKQNTENSSSADTNSVITMLKDQLSQMSESYKQCEGVIHKTKKLIEFGDKKNEQLSKELLELKKTVEDQKLSLEKERKEKEKILQSNQLLEEENRIILSKNKVFEDNCTTYCEEMKLLKDEITSIISNEDNFEKCWKNEQNANNELKKQIQELRSTVSLSRKNRKRLHDHFEQELMKTKSEEEKEIVLLVQEEMTRYKNQLMCPICKSKPKEYMLSQCMHIFCKDCIDERIAKRERKCPCCLSPFGVNDKKKIWIFEDSSLFEELKGDE